MPESFDESNADFYDLEYYLSMEYRYFSGAHGSRVRNILAALGDLSGLSCLDVGCGGGYFAHEMQMRGADVVGIDYSPFAIRFAKSRYPEQDVRVCSGYALEAFESSCFDLVTLIDVIEHVADQHRLLSEAHRVLKRDGRLVVSTDVEGGPWKRRRVSRLIDKTLVLSSEGRAYRMIARVEKHRRQFTDYHRAHIATLTTEGLVNVLRETGFVPVHHRVYPLVSVAIRDLVLRLLPSEWRGDHQCIVAEKLCGGGSCVTGRAHGRSSWTAGSVGGAGA